MMCLHAPHRRNAAAGCPSGHSTPSSDDRRIRTPALPVTTATAAATAAATACGGGGRTGSRCPVIHRCPFIVRENRAQGSDSVGRG